MGFLGQLQKISSRWERSNGNAGNGSSGRKLASCHPSGGTKWKNTRGMVPGTRHRAIHVLPLEANLAESSAKHTTGGRTSFLLFRACHTRKILQNLRQPHVRPIVRGKAGHPVEFGQKLGFSVVDGYRNQNGTDKLPFWNAKGTEHG